MAEEKRARKPNWAKSEICALIEAVAIHQALISSKFKTTDCNKKKQAAWGDIVQAVRAQNACADRLAEEVKKKWKDLVSQARKDVHIRKNPKTGGGPKPQEGEWTDTILDMFGQDSPMFAGIKGGGESGHEPICLNSQITYTIPVAVGVPFNLPQSVDPDCAVIEVHEAAESSMTLTSEPLHTATAGIINAESPPHADEVEEVAASVPQIPTSNPKRKKPFAGGPTPKQQKTESASVTYEDLLSVDIDRAKLEKEKLQLEIEKINDERECIDHRRRQRAKEEELLEMKKNVLQIKTEVLLLQKEKLQQELIQKK